MKFENPYRPGAGHMPPHLAGREAEYAEFVHLLQQTTILENLVLTGLRGVGKTVLLEKFKPIALENGWGWVGADLSQSASVSELTIAERLLADLAVATSGVSVEVSGDGRVGFGAAPPPPRMPISYAVLVALFESTPGLIVDKLKAVLEFSWQHLDAEGSGKLVFAYDEAQNLADNPSKDQYPLSMLLDLFQSVQRKGIPFFLLLTGLPTLFPKLVEARTYAERMFRVVMLSKLDDNASREAIIKPIDHAQSPVRFDEPTVALIVKKSGGYPYFIQFICREIFDVFIRQAESDEPMVVPLDGIERKLDTDFFAGRWARVTDRQRQLLWVIATIQGSADEFTIQDLVEHTKSKLPKPFSASHTNQMLVSLAQQGLIYKNRFGKYSFAVPLLGDFILRTYTGPSGSGPLAGDL
ncbi:MAG: AAA family ATPase [Acidimicrobiales bacterium]